MNLDLLLSGMPCCRYLLIRLKHEEDAHCFTKFVVRTLHSVDMPANDICGALAILSTSLPFSHPLLGYDFYSFPGIQVGVEPEVFVEKVLADDTVASYKHCYEYCKTLDKSTRFCSLCPLSKFYSNEYVKEELEIIRFALESKDNFSYLVEKGVDEKHFPSVLDIHGSLRLEVGVVEKPFFFNIAKLIWQQIVGNVDKGFFEQSYEDRCSFIKSNIHDLFIGRYFKIVGRNSAISESVCTVQVENYMESKKCIDKEKVDAILSLIMKEKKLNAPSTAAVDSNIKESNIIDFYSKKQLSGEGLKEDREPISDKKPEIEDVVVEPVTEETVHEEEPVSFEVPKEENSHPDAEPMLPVSVENDESQTASGDSSTNEENADDLSYRELGYVYKASSVLYDKSDKEGFLGVPIVKKKELEHFSLNLDESKQRLVAMVESHAMQDKRLSVELVVLEDKKTYLILLYSYKLHAYFHSFLKSEYVKDVLKSILTIPSITKYCYYPYFLASYLMKSGIYIKGLKSLFSLSAIVYGQHNLLIDECLDTMGAYKAEGGVHVKPKGEIISLPLLYMHCYYQVYQKHRKELTGKGLVKELDERNQFDVLLGRYYYQDLYSKKNATLFTLRDSVGYHFLNEELNYKENGYLLTYTFKHLPIQLAHLLRELLCLMETKGYFKKYGVMITGVGPSSFSLFVVKKDMRKMDTLIDTSLVFFLRDNELRGVRYSLNRKLVSVPEEKK